ncbi:hypothetical protein DRI50_00455 [candidate division KSB1 bacterium]|nr:MAG: hypothetical protein DRI50_00455 [candidate division KSB1 bacterium]
MRTMKMFAFVFLLLTLVYGQNSIDSLLAHGESIRNNRGNMDLIYHYKLPTWHYFVLYTDLTGSMRGNNYARGERKTDLDQHTLIFTPFYKYVWQSEQKTALLRLSARNLYNYQKDKLEERQSTRTQKYTKKESYFRMAGNLNRYIADAWFLNFQGDGKFNYQENTYDYRKEMNGDVLRDKRSSITREFYFNANLGFGYGRIRDVTPVFRALAFNRRLEAVTGRKFDNLQDLAVAFTRQAAYWSLYERSAKYFYYSLPEAIGTTLKNLQAWQLMYLNDSFSELIGTRREGSETRGGLSLNYHKESDSFGTKPYASGVTQLGLYLQHAYYHNFSPYYQLGANVSMSLNKVVDTSPVYDYSGNMTMTLSNLLNLTDRLLCNFDLQYQTLFISGGKDGVKSWERQIDYSGRLSFLYRVENHIYLTSNMDWQKIKLSPLGAFFYYNGDLVGYSGYSKTEMWSIDFGLRYYFSLGVY